MTFIVWGENINNTSIQIYRVRVKVLMSTPLSTLFQLHRAVWFGGHRSTRRQRIAGH